MSSIIPTWPRPHMSAEQRKIAENLANPDFSLTRLMQEHQQREASGDAAREAEAAAAEAQKAAETEAAKVAEQEAKARAEREAHLAEMKARAEANIERIRERAEQNREEWKAARLTSILKNHKW